MRYETDPATAEDAAIAAANLARWTDTGPSDYVFVQSIGCFCDDADMDVRVVVEGGVVTSVVALDSGVALTAAWANRTMTELLELAQTSTTAGYDSYQAEYDEELGYLMELFVDESVEYADDEWGVEVSCLATDTDESSCPIVTIAEADCVGLLYDPPTAVLVDPPEEVSSAYEVCGDSAYATGIIQATGQVCCEQWW